ncbi:MAG: biopolymer transporter ExbD [Verrucomicrobiota bacterium]
MNFRDYSTPQEAEMELAPMIDVVFLLLIFFIVTWNSAQQERNVDVSVPAAEEGADPERQVGEIIVNVDKGGVIVVNGAVVTEDDLLARLHAISEEYPDQAVILRGDSKASFQHIINILDVCKKANIWNIAFATTKPVEALAPKKTGTAP